jgi:hypothetical protein
MLPPSHLPSHSFIRSSARTQPNLSHHHAFVGRRQAIGAENARPIEYPSPLFQCTTGVFAGQTIRAQVTEIQKADVGRKSVVTYLPILDQLIPCSATGTPRLKIDAPWIHRLLLSSKFGKSPLLTDALNERLITGIHPFYFTFVCSPHSIGQQVSLASFNPQVSSAISRCSSLH